MNYDVHSGDILAKAGYQYMQNNEFEQAEKFFRLALSAGCSNNVELYGFLSFFAEQKLDYVGSWEYIDKSYKILLQEENKGDILFQCTLLINRADKAKRLGKFQEAIESYNKILEISPHLYDWQSALDGKLYSLICSCQDNKQVIMAHMKYNEIYSDLRKKITVNNFEKEKYKHEKIKIGYMSPDFRQHVMFSFYYVLLSQYDKSKFHVTCYQLKSIEDGYTNHLKLMVDDWRNMSGVSTEMLAEQIKSDEIDILVDLAGHSSNNGLPVFVYKPAPVQISGLGWMETTGLQETDYFITDKFVDPINSNDLMEEPLYLDSQFCYTAREDLPIPKGAPCLDVGYVTFGVFNNYYKFNDNILELWKEIMDRVENSVLLLKCQLYISESAVKMAYERFEKLGFDVNRIQFEPATNTYMNRYLDVDIALDTYPYTGGGTTCDALYMGIPVISLYGQRRGSRFSYSILNNIGLGILTAESGEEYVEKAVALAENKDILDFLHKNIRSMMVKSPVMDSNLYMRQLEQQYKKLLEKKYESIR